MHWNTLTASEWRFSVAGVGCESLTNLEQADLWVEFLKEDGRVVPMLVDILDQTQSEDGFICIALDQTAYKQVQQQLIQRQANCRR